MALTLEEYSHCRACQNLCFEIDQRGTEGADQVGAESCTDAKDDTLPGVLKTLLLYPPTGSRLSSREVPLPINERKGGGQRFWNSMYKSQVNNQKGKQEPNDALMIARKKISNDRN